MFLSLLKDKPFLRATAVLIGTMVGVGVFGIPFSFAKAGFWIGLSFLLGVGAITLLLDLMYGEVVLRTHKVHQLVGYTEAYLGTFWKRLIFFSIILNTYAALLAYIIIAGDFLNNIFAPVFYSSSSTFSIWFFVIASFLILFGIRTVSWVELVLACMFIVIIFLIFGFGIPKIELANYSFSNPELWFLPYGVLLFAFGGLSSIPIQRQLLVNEEYKFKRSIFTAVTVVGVLYFIFAFAVLGISGETTSSDAISGLVDFMGSRIIFLGSLFGVLAISTSYLMLGTAMLEIFHLDYEISRKWSWLLVIIPPLVLFLGGLRNFIDVISLAGAVAVGLEAFILIFVFCT
ncbi:MAG: amino acid permease [Candidatus Yanofskybacteria bacterium]|nr:amino acid permease [Candidatus Yanofskybacteria bacterium]